MGSGRVWKRISGRPVTCGEALSGAREFHLRYRDRVGQNVEMIYKKVVQKA